MNIKELAPLHDLILVRPDEPEGTTDSGLIITVSLDFVACTGTVLRVGPGRVLDDGTRVQPTVQVNDRVAWSPKQKGQEFTVNGETMMLINEANLLGKIN